MKARLDAVEARLDEIQGEIRSLALRLPEPARRGAYEDDLVIRATSPAAEAVVARPPIPPASWAPETGRSPAHWRRATSRGRPRGAEVGPAEIGRSLTSKLLKTNIFRNIQDCSIASTASGIECPGALTAQ